MEGSLGMPPPDEQRPKLSLLQQQLIKRRMHDWNQATGIQPAGGEYTASLGN